MNELLPLIVLFVSTCCLWYFSTWFKGIIWQWLNLEQQYTSTDRIKLDYG